MWCDVMSCDQMWCDVMWCDVMMSFCAFCWDPTCWPMMVILQEETWKQRGLWGFSNQPCVPPLLVHQAERLLWTKLFVKQAQSSGKQRSSPLTSGALRFLEKEAEHFFCRVWSGVYAFCWWAAREFLAKNGEIFVCYHSCQYMIYIARQPLGIYGFNHLHWKEPFFCYCCYFHLVFLHIFLIKVHQHYSKI